MITTELVPMHKFIATDLIGNRYFNKYSVGYIYASFPNHDNNVLACVTKGLITRVGKLGKERLRPIEFSSAPILFPEFIEDGYYDPHTFILAKPECVNVLTMSNFDFLAWAYAVILRLDCKRIAGVVPNPYNKLVKAVRTIARNFDDYTAQDIAVAVGTVHNREHIVSEFHRLSSFVRKVGEVTSDNNVNMLKRHYDVCDKAALRKIIYTYLSSLTENKKLPKEAQTESANVLQKYENSGYWF